MKHSMETVMYAGNYCMEIRVYGQWQISEIYYPLGLDMSGRSSTGTPVLQGFTGYWRDTESSLNMYYSGARMYGPGTGRFFGVDPLAEEFATWSTYVYSMNSPMVYVDPDGRSADDPKAKMQALKMGASGFFTTVSGASMMIGGAAGSIPTVGVSATVSLSGMGIMGAGITTMVLAMQNYGRSQPFNATSSLKTTFGEYQLRTLRGRPLNSSWMRSRSS